MKLYIVLILSILFLSCNKPATTPEEYPRKERLIFGMSFWKGMPYQEAISKMGTGNIQYTLPKIDFNPDSPSKSFASRSIHVMDNEGNIVVSLWFSSENKLESFTTNVDVAQSKELTKAFEHLFTMLQTLKAKNIQVVMHSNVSESGIMKDIMFVSDKGDDVNFTLGGDGIISLSLQD